MSHEIRTPMTAILGYAELLEMHKDTPGDEDFDPTAAIKSIKQSGSHLLDLINDILDLSKIEAGRMTVEQIEFDPCDTIASVASLLRPQVTAKGVAFEVRFNGPIPVTLNADPTRAKQVIMNLVGNATKFTTRGSVTIEISTGIEADQATLYVDVVDTGIGMTPEKARGVFAKFEQADATVTRKFGGTGLGLAISKELAGMMGGELCVLRSEEGVGSTFRFAIPLGDPKAITWNDSPSEALTITKTCRSTPTDALPLSGRRVLLVEDGPDNRRLIGFHLRKAGADVQEAENGRLGVDAAVEQRDAGPPHDLVLMDMQMPVLDGYSAAAALRAHGFTTPIVALTAHAMAGDRDKCLRAGCSSYATKPINRTSLISTCAGEIENGRGGRANAA